MARAGKGRPQDRGQLHVHDQTLISPDAAQILCRSLHDGAVMGLWGACAYLAALVPRDLARETAARLSGPGIVAVGLALVTTILALPLAAASVGEGWASAGDPQTLWAVLVDTSVGQAWQAQAAAALGMAAACFAPKTHRCGALAASAALCLLTLTLTGHASMHEGWLGLTHRLNDGLHLLAGGAWLGSLVPLPVILRASSDPTMRFDAGLALQRFSRAGHGLVALVIATGIANTALVLGRWPFDWASPYQALLAAKIGLVATMVVLALVNRYAVVPRRAAPGIRCIVGAITLVEIGLGAAVIGLVAVFGSLEPR